MLTELAEVDARGEIAEIFAEIRDLYATPYISSIHRHMATRPGVLEWAWQSAAPAFRSGRAQRTAWRIAETVALPPLAVIPPEALTVWDVRAADVPMLRAIAESFTRVAPLNLVFGGIVRDLLRDGPTSVIARPIDLQERWIPPAVLAPPPPMVNLATLAESQRRLLELFKSGTGDTAFVPGLYRMLARWPLLLAHFAVELRPHLAGDEKARIAASLLVSIDAAVAELCQSLRPAALPAPAGDEAAHLQRMIEGYRVTSPEMILFGKLIGEALSD